MKIRVFSDVHLEFGPFDPPQVEADAVILAGDIWYASQGIRWARDLFPPERCVYVAGNHEFYGTERNETLEKCRAAAEDTGINFLENDVTVIGNVRFVGTTLWTDFRLFGGGGVQISAMKDAMRWVNDFRQISMIEVAKRRRMRPADVCGFHRSAREFLSNELERPYLGRTVVVTHFAPSRRSIPAKYAHQRLSSYDASNLEDLIEMHQPDLWVHGHTHESHDYWLGRTHVVCNPRGYVGHELNPNFDPGLIIEL